MPIKVTDGIQKLRCKSCDRYDILTPRGNNSKDSCAPTVSGSQECCVVSRCRFSLQGREVAGLEASMGGNEMCDGHVWVGEEACEGVAKSLRGFNFSWREIAGLEISMEGNERCDGHAWVEDCGEACEGVTRGTFRSLDGLYDGLNGMEMSGVNYFVFAQKL